jgi:DNA-binding YbaB/EbfC family protein
MNLGKMMKQAKALQQQMAKAQEEIAELRVEGTAGGGVITAVMDGQKNLLDLKISPDAIDPEDPEMLQDLILSAVSEATRKVDEEVQEKMGGLTGGLGGMPGLGGLFG